MTWTPMTLGEKVVLGLACGLLISLLILSQVPNLNVWGDVGEIEVTPTGLRTWTNKAGVTYWRITERGGMGVFFIRGNVPEEMDVGVSYSLTARLGWWGPDFAKALPIYKVERWVAHDG